MKKNIFILFVMAALAACSGGGSSSSSSDNSGNTHGTGASSTPITSQPIIDNEDMTPGLKGVDANNNGIRDDIDRLIAKKYVSTPAIKKAAEQEARAMQKSMEATTRTQALAAGDGIMRAAACTYKILPHSTPQEIEFRETMSKEIEALTANTKERFTKYWESEALGGGAIYEQAKEPVCD